MHMDLFCTVYLFSAIWCFLKKTWRTDGNFCFCGAGLSSKKPESISEGSFGRLEKRANKEFVGYIAYPTCALEKLRNRELTNFSAYVLIEEAAKAGKQNPCLGK